MESKLERGEFVHVVATVDLAKNAGEICLRQSRDDQNGNRDAG